MPLFNFHKRRTSYPRKWSSDDWRYYYKQCIPQAFNIAEIPSSLAHSIAEIIRNTSPLKSDWKKIARSLGINNESQLKDIEDAAVYKQELPLYIALTSNYLTNPAASLGELLNSLMELERYDVLIKIKDDVQEIIRQYNKLKTTPITSGLKTTPITSGFQQDLKNKPVEDESMLPENISHDNKSERKQHLGDYCSNDSQMDFKKENNHDSAFYDQSSFPSSLLEILSNCNERTKSYDNSVDYCHSSNERNEKCEIVTYWGEKSQKEENFAGSKTLSDANGNTSKIPEFEFINPSGRKESLTADTSWLETKSGNYSDVTVEESSPSSSHVKPIMVPNADSEKSSKSLLSEQYSDSDSSCDDDFDTNLLDVYDADAITSYKQCTEMSSLPQSYNNNKLENEKFQHLCVDGYVKPKIKQYEDQCSGTKAGTYDNDNSVNERIEDLVAEKDELIKNVERAERESAFSLQKSMFPKKPQDSLLAFVSTVLHDTAVNLDRSIKVIVIHSEEDADTAVNLAHVLVKEFDMAAVAECELSAFWVMDRNHYIAALYWADVIIPLITNNWLEDITNEKPLLERDVPSLNARSVFRILQDMFSNRGSVNLSSIPVVLEGTRRCFTVFPEIRDAVKLSREFQTDKRMKSLGNLIKNFHSITRSDKRKHLDYM